MKPRPTTLARLRIIRDMTDDGASNNDIAAALGITPGAVSSLRRHHGLPPAPRKGPTHGLPSTYKAYGCRCRRCTAANTRAVQEATRRRAERRDTSTFKHGAGGYKNWGCRCETCTKANTAANREPQRRWRERQRAAKAGAS